METFKIAIAADHAGFGLKEELIKMLQAEGHQINDLGTYSDESIDYPEFAHRLAKTILDKKADYGIAICGSGNGMSMTVNKYDGIRSALCWNAEIAQLARNHNDANICSLPGRFLNKETSMLIVKTFLESGFDGGRHERRIRKIPLTIIQ